MPAGTARSNLLGMGRGRAGEGEAGSLGGRRCAFVYCIVLYSERGEAPAASGLGVELSFILAAALPTSGSASLRLGIAWRGTAVVVWVLGSIASASASVSASVSVSAC